MVEERRLRTYTLVFNNYADLIHALRKLRKRGVRLHFCVMVVSAEHWNSVKDVMSSSSKKQVVLVLSS